MVLAPHRAAGVDEVVDALAAQTRALEGVILVERSGNGGVAGHERLDGMRTCRLPAGSERFRAFNDALRMALKEEADWIWLLDTDVVPSPSALECLLRPLEADEALPPPVLVAGKVILPDGRLDGSSAPWPRLTEKEVGIAAARHRLLSIRAARHGSLLVGRHGVETYGLMRPEHAAWGDDFEWTARMLATRPGYLAPRSLAVRRAPSPQAGRRSSLSSLRAARSQLAILRGNSLSAEERAWLGFSLARDAVSGTARWRK